MGYSFETQERLCNFVNTFQKILDESNKLWVDKGSEFYNRSMKRQ